MPFKSVAQQRFMFAKKPELAKEMASKTKDFKSLPQKVGKPGGSTYQKMLKADK